MQMIASYFFVSAIVRAAEGISNAPGTRTIAMPFLVAPSFSNPSHALDNSRSVINSLNRETTTAKRLPEALSLPSIAAKAGSGTDSTFNLIFSVISVSSVVNKLRRSYLPLNCA